jgi:RNA polymerase sigma-70 factor (ECF subfamily)
VQVGVGDRAAFDMLYRTFSARVFGLASRILRSTSHAEEVAQEVFVEIWRRASRFDPARGSATSWILTMTHNRSIDRVRSTQAARDRDHADYTQSFRPDTDSVSEAVLDGEEQTQVRRCLAQLTAVQHQAVTLAYFGGHTYTEVAGILGAALPTVKTRIRDGLIRLRDCLTTADQ